MKKFLFIIISILLCFQNIAFADEDYIHLMEYPYSSHVLGEDLVIYGKTSLDNVTLGLYYPQDGGYFGYAKFVMAITKSELENGYVIPTDTYSKLWPKGDWTVRVQNGDVKAAVTIPMSDSASFDREVRIATYSSDTLNSLETYYTRGVLIKDNVISFTLEDNTTVRIFSWNNLSPAAAGESRVFVAFYNDGYLTDIKTLSGTLTSYFDHVAIENDEKKLKIFYWNENLTPIRIKGL